VAEPAGAGDRSQCRSEALTLRHAFEDLGCQRVEFDTDGQNARSRRALEGALPAVLEGILTDHTLLPGGPRRSSAIYDSILDSEWPDVGAHLQRRVERHVSPPDDQR
jgi:N-acetyltransferase